MSSVPKGLRAKVDALLASIVPHYRVMPDGGLGSDGFGMMLYEGALIQLLDVGPSGLTSTEFETSRSEGSQRDHQSANRVLLGV